MTYFREVSTFDSRDPASDKALLRRDLLAYRGLNRRPDLDDDHFYIVVEPWEPAQSMATCARCGEPVEEGARHPLSLGLGKPVHQRCWSHEWFDVGQTYVDTFSTEDRGSFLIEELVPFDDPDAEDDKKKRKKELATLLAKKWNHDTEFMCSICRQLRPIHQRPSDNDNRCADCWDSQGPPAITEARQHWLPPLCRECWRDGITTSAVDDPIRPWQRSWRLCKKHSTAERRARTHLRSNVPCVACGYRFDRRKGGALDEACHQEWRRARKRGTSWFVFAKSRHIRERARRIIETLECEDNIKRVAMSLARGDVTGDISPAWRAYLKRAIGANPTKGVILVLEGQSGTVVPLGRPVTASASSSNGSARAASFVFSPHSIAKHLGGAYDTNGKRFTSFVSRPPHGGCR